MNDLIPTPPVLDALEAGTATPDQFLEAVNLMSAMTAALAEVKKRHEAAAIAWLDANGGEIQCGDVRYYVGPSSSTKCNDEKAAFKALLESAGGDIDAVADCIASGGLKSSSCRAVLRDAFADHFTTTTKPDLKTGAPNRRLQSVNERFVVRK